MTVKQCVDRRHGIFRFTTIATATESVLPEVASANGGPSEILVPPATDAVQRFEFHVPESALADLKMRLANTRFPDEAEVSDWSQGVPLQRQRRLIDHWQHRYDWREAERILNGFGQYRTLIDGLGIHFLHIRSPHQNAKPLLLTHGWPGSQIEFFKAIPRLTDPTRHGGRAEDAFHVVAPSLPGYGLSDHARNTSWTRQRVATAWALLMERLGYGNYLAAGGDWGAVISTYLGAAKPKGLEGIHLTQTMTKPHDLDPAHLTPEQLERLTTEEKTVLAQMNEMSTERGGYGAIQSTRPQTLGYALHDSPAGQAAWIYEKFGEWTDSGNNPESVLTLDEMLHNITWYWLTGTATSSAQFYWVNLKTGMSTNALPVDVPVGVSMFPKELWGTPRRWAEATYSKLVYFNHVARGGHFSAFEQPELWTDELRKFGRIFR
jgi:pimeloyl-ACP methyl ester carboxylesterase